MAKNGLAQKPQNDALQRGLLPKDGFGQRAFVGSLDDSVSRYPWNGHVPSRDFLNELIIQNALFGTPLCCRIGNILYHDPYFKALMSSDHSPLQAFLRSGFFQVQMLDETINTTIEQRRKRKTNSTLKFIRDKQWTEGSEIFKKLDEIDLLLEPGRGKIKYNSAFPQVFRNLMEHVSEKDKISDEDINYILESWYKLGAADQTRSNFENLALKLKSEQKIRSELNAMRMANAVNHFAYGVVMAKLSSDADVFEQSISWPDLITECTKSHSVSHEVALAADNRFQKDAIGSTIKTHIRIPNELFYNTILWNRLSDAVNPSNNQKNAEIFRNRKIALLTELQYYLIAPEEFNLNKMIQIMKEFSMALTDILEVKIEFQETAQLHILKYVNDIRRGFVGEGLKAVGGAALAAVSPPPIQAIAGGAFSIIVSPLGASKFSRKKNRISTKEVEIEGGIPIGLKNETSPGTETLTTRVIDPAKAFNFI